MRKLLWRSFSRLKKRSTRRKLRGGGGDFQLVSGIGTLGEIRSEFLNLNLGDYGIRQKKLPSGPLNQKVAGHMIQDIKDDAEFISEARSLCSTSEVEPATTQYWSNISSSRFLPREVWIIFMTKTIGFSWDS